MVGTPVYLNRGQPREAVDQSWGKMKILWILFFLLASTEGGKRGGGLRQLYKRWEMEMDSSSS